MEREAIVRYTVLLRKTAPQVNAEECTIYVVADTEADARKQAQAALDADQDNSPGLSWANIGNLDLWDQPERRVIVSIE